MGTANIIADKADTIFTGNTANNISNALYQTSGTTNLNASESANIIFNDGIDGNIDYISSNIININNTGVKMADGTTDAPTTGVIEFNNEVKNNTVNMYNGVLKFGTNTQNGVDYAGTFADSVNFNYQGGILTLQNGGTLGAVGMAYKGNFFTGLTLNVGANAGEANTMFGHEDFAMLMTGVASKTGYNFELAKGKFIIQPSLLMSYSFINTFDYKNAAGVSINSDPLHAIQLEPGIKFIGNLPNGWQPYAGVSVVWNIMDRTHFNANDVSLPNLSINPFVKYGVGVRKSWGERFTGFFQTYITNGGRNGVGLQAGLRWTLGKTQPSGTNKVSSNLPEKNETKLTLNNNLI